MEEDGLDEEEVAQGVADGLVDEVDEGAQVGQRGGLGRGGGRGAGGGEEGEGRGGEEDRAVAVGLEVDADVVRLGGVVEVLDARRDARDGDALCDVGGGVCKRVSGRGGAIVRKRRPDARGLP